MKLWQVTIWFDTQIRLVSVKATSSAIAIKKAMDKAKKILTEENYKKISKVEVEEY